MPRLYNKINLPTNTTDTKMFAKYLKAIDEKGVVNRDEEQELFASVKIAESRKDVAEPKRDTHTKQTLYQFGLIDLLDDGGFAVSSLGKELIDYDNFPESYSEESRIALMLKIFINWEVKDEQFNRKMHPGFLMIKLLCDPDLDFYLTNHEFASFVSNGAFVSDAQYDEIKKSILDFRSDVGISEYVAQTKAGIFLASLVNNWQILTAESIDLNANQNSKADEYFKQSQNVADSEAEEESGSEITEDDSSPTKGLSNSQRNAYNAFHTIKEYRLNDISSKLSQSFLYLLNGSEIKLFDWYYKKGQNLSHHLPKGTANQRIYFGAPGTGKSYRIKHEIIPEGVEPYRVTFYPDYYSDFVGGLRPQKGTNGIEYNFEAGPFAKALLESFSKPTYLIIEEINRGNAAAVFGDIFQLLDRKGGKSEYSITNHDLFQYLLDNKVTCLEKDKVYLPANLHILCTMNTADQNVFVLDTAFRRRFKMEYIPIDFNAYYKKNEKGEVTDIVKDKCKGYINNTEIFNGKGFKQDLEAVMTPEVYKIVTKTIKNPKRDWATFASYVNAKIDSINSLELKISEDKKLGPFFVEPDELNDIQAFTDKVIYYLKQDVFKYEDNILMDSYEELYDRYVNKKKDVFELFEPTQEQ